MLHANLKVKTGNYKMVDLPDRLLSVFILANCHSRDLATLVEVLDQLLLRRLEVNILHKDTSIVWIVVSLWLSASRRHVLDTSLLLHGQLLVDEVLV